MRDNLDFSKKYIMNPLIRGRWNDTTSFTLQNALTKKKYSLSFNVFDLMLFCSKPKTLSAIAEEIKKEFNSSGTNINELLSQLLDKEFIVEKKAFKYKLWFERNWRNALYFHSLTSNYQFADMGQKDEFKTKTDILKGYLQESSFPAFYKEYDGGIKLPKPKMGYVSTGKTILERRTTRRFDDQPITLQQLSTILYYSCQPAKIVRDYANVKKKDNPMILILSAYTPYEIYFSNNNMEDLDRGLYHYNMNKHEIHLIKKGKFNKKMKEIAIGQVGIEDASVVFLISSMFHRYMWRYRNSRAYRNLLIECASLAHRIVLATEALGLKQFITPALRDSKADDLFGLDGYSEAFTYLVSIGNKFQKK